MIFVSARGTVFYLQNIHNCTKVISKARRCYIGICVLHVSLHFFFVDGQLQQHFVNTATIIALIEPFVWLTGNKDISTYTKIYRAIIELVIMSIALAMNEHLSGPAPSLS